MRLGFIGLGTMGRPMAFHLVGGGHSLAFFVRRPEAGLPFTSAGATACSSPAAVAERSEVVFTMVTGTADVEQIVLGKDGVIQGARPGSLVIDMSTIDPTATRALATTLGAQEIDMLDAPVSGGPQGAQAATLTIMVGGPTRALDLAKPLLHLLGPTIIHLGNNGAGQTAKACHQLALLVTAQGVAEALALAGRSGLDLERVRQVMLGGVASSRVLELFGAKMVSRDFKAGIESRLYHKDLGIALDLAHDRGLALPAAAVTMQHVNALVGKGRERDDLSVLITLLEEMSARVDPSQT
ncbi:MAG: 2-hydroxy-3-oxopropionate reductase [Acidobacteria bacterium]|nr:2-hydroxy-3-oxopropionate reductase [Acidobacteriota bacterium]|tara:strand:- start:3112 stop:4002 length:891 start_codon:yes stop_codon:yes gene_type:complete